MPSMNMFDSGIYTCMSYSVYQIISCLIGWLIDWLLINLLIGY